MFRVHFPFLDTSRDALSLTCALRAGGLSGATGSRRTGIREVCGVKRPGRQPFPGRRPRRCASADLPAYGLSAKRPARTPGPDDRRRGPEAKDRLHFLLIRRRRRANQCPLWNRLSPIPLYRPPPSQRTSCARGSCRPPGGAEHHPFPPRFRGSAIRGLLRLCQQSPDALGLSSCGQDQKSRRFATPRPALRALQRTRGLRTNFLVRQMYRAGMRGRFHHFAKGEFKPRAQFWDNIFSNDYTLCLRGAGNFSYRLYEVLASARIPLFINTNCVLPLQDEIDWKRHCVWVEEDQIDSAGKILQDFHSRLTPEEFRNLQLANRRLWEEKLSPLGFWKAIVSREITAPAPAPEAPHYYYSSSQNPPHN